MEDATCSPIDAVKDLPVIEGVQAEKVDAASSPADTTVDAQSSPIDVDQKDSTSSPVIALFQKDELISPMTVEVCDKETWTGSPEDQTAGRFMYSHVFRRRVGSHYETGNCDVPSEPPNDERRGVQSDRC
ncbi:hypothetical protein MTO96_011118 [Rhipicephalus appendiculatus]